MPGSTRPRTAAQRRDGIHVYRSRDGWRWRLLRRGRIVAESGEGYVNRTRCIDQAFTVLDASAYPAMYDDDTGETTRYPPARPTEFPPAPIRPKPSTDKPDDVKVK